MPRQGLGSAEEPGKNASIGPGFSITPVNAAADFLRVSTLLSSLLPGRLLCMVSCENAPAVQRKGNVSPANEI